MAKANWLTATPSTGSGNGTVSVSTAQHHTGRTARSTTLTFTAANCTPVERTVNQAGKPEYSEMQGTASADKNGKTLTITGKSNSSKLTFTLGNMGGTNNLEITLPAQYTANSVQTTNGTAIAGDPGAAAEYNFSISIVVPSNPTIDEKSRQLIVTDAAGNTATCIITSGAGDAYLRVTTADPIALSYQGTAVSVAVESNTTWTVS